MSVADAAVRNFKVDLRGAATELRSEDVSMHLIVNYMNVIAMALANGWQRPSPEACGGSASASETTSAAHGNGWQRPSPEACGGSASASETTSAAKFVMSQVRAGVRVNLVPKTRRNGAHHTSIYLQNIKSGTGGTRQLRARFIPVALMRSRDVKTRDKNKWTESFFAKKSMRACDAWPVAWVGKKKWESPREGRPWPRVVAETYAGHTGMSQVGRLSVVFENA
jgi:hypothetical protein